jgi:hypothetical protein
VASEETEAVVKVAEGEVVGLAFEALSALLGGRPRVEVEVAVVVAGPMREVRRGLCVVCTRSFGAGGSVFRGFVGEGER